MRARSSGERAGHGNNWQRVDAQGVVPFNQVAPSLGRGPLPRSDLWLFPKRWTSRLRSLEKLPIKTVLGYGAGTSPSTLLSA